MAKDENLQLLGATPPPQRPHQREQVPDNEIDERPEQAPLLDYGNRAPNLASPARQRAADEFANPTRYAGNGRAPSAALLIWFLQHVMLLDEDEAIDCVCDGPNDKGIDGIWVDTVAENINLLQAKRRASLGSTQGDVEVRRLVWAAKWFRSPEKVDDLLAAAPNPELRGLIERNDIQRRLREGYTVRCVFVTNAKFDAAGRDYVEAHADGTPPLDGWDIRTMEPYIRYADRSSMSTRRSHLGLRTVLCSAQVRWITS